MIEVNSPDEKEQELKHKEIKMSNGKTVTGILKSDPKFPYLIYETKQKILQYNKNYGDDRRCICGHSYARHFDFYDEIFSGTTENEAIGCKYCPCTIFVEKTKDMTEDETQRILAFHQLRSGDTALVYDTETSHDYIEHKIKITSVENDIENVTEKNPTGLIFYGEDLEEEEFGDDYMTTVTIQNFIGKQED